MRIITVPDKSVAFVFVSVAVKPTIKYFGPEKIISEILHGIPCIRSFREHK